MLGDCETHTVRKIGKTKLFAFALAILFPATNTGATDLDLARFATAKAHEIREFADTTTNKVPALVWSFFDAVRVDDWETATNLADRLSLASGRYVKSATNETLSPALRTVIWPPISEMIGTYEQFHNWDTKWLHRFGREIIESIPRDGIYFGGTDPGRFIITALAESRREEKPFFILTQNQLVDESYLARQRRLYSKQLHLPTSNDVATAMGEYIADVQERLKHDKLKPGEDIRKVNGRVEVSGQVAVMEINGLVAKCIVTNNPDRKFYIEESFTLDWMYPHLSPQGLIFELHTKPLKELGNQEVQQDLDYWKRTTGDAIGDWLAKETSVREICGFADKVHLRKDLTGYKGDPAFAKNREAQMCFSKLRSAIAGLYAWREEHANDPGEKLRFQQAADLSFRQAYALYPASPEAVYRYANFLTGHGRQDDALLLVKTSLRLDPDNAYFPDLLKSLSQ